MNEIYNLLDMLLPFDWIGYSFMKNALLAVLLMTPLFGLLGTMIVSHKMAFFSDALGHSAVTGVAIGVLFGMTNTNAAMVIFAVIFALVLGRIKNTRRASTDTVISVFSSMGLAVGLAILSLQGNFSQYSNLLIGDILSITEREILGLLIVLMATLVFWYFYSNALSAMSINISLAKSKEINTVWADNVFVVLIAIVVMLSIQWVGLLLINALLILPAATSRNISKNMREYLGYSVAVSMISGVGGLIISYYNGIASGPMIVMIAGTMFFTSFAVKK